MLHCKWTGALGGERGRASGVRVIHHHAFYFQSPVSVLQMQSGKLLMWDYSHFRREKMSKETRELTLRKGRFDKSVIYKVKKHDSVIFKLAPEFFEDETLSIFINYPEDGSQFDRDKYQDIFKVKKLRKN